MKKRIFCALTAAALLLAAGCSGEGDRSGSGNSQPAEGSVQSSSTAQEGDSPSVLTLTANNQNGEMTVSRPAAKNQKMGEKDTWTIFVYMCGTDLESLHASATGDVQQMLEAEASDNVKFVIQTGGTKTWNNEFFHADKAERFVVSNNDINNVGSVDLASMGDPENLKGFLKWGVENYPADKMGVIFWDHGSGSINGVCFDELNNSDSLSLNEIDQALSDVYADMTDSFEFIGLDACLMGTLETANVLATYGRYMYASQECEPGTGWNYTAIGTQLAQHPDCDGAALGKVITDSFYEECKASGQEGGSTLTVVDLKKIDDLIVAFNDYSYRLYNATSDNFAGIIRGINSAENFGGNNKSEGYTNMIDIGGIIQKCSDYADGAATLKALESCISYKKNGVSHKNASGLSVYYPLCIQGSEELTIFSNVCTSPYYLSLVDMVAKGYSEDTYSNDAFFNESGEWLSTAPAPEGYFHYESSQGESTESSVINCKELPHLDDDGNYCFTLDEQSLEYTASVQAYIYMKVDDDLIVELGETYDINADWDTGEFSDNFDGYWLSLPNETLLAAYIVDNDEDYAVYTSPINLNGSRTNLRIIVDDDGTHIEGAWDGIDENGFAAREIRPLKEGDKIEPLYYYQYEGETDTFANDPYTWKDGDEITYSYLPSADYSYSFNIKDVYGGYHSTDNVIFTIDEEGDILFEKSGEEAS